jgi:hypothetical protein
MVSDGYLMRNIPMHARFVNISMKVPHLFNANPLSLANFYLEVLSRRGERTTVHNSVLTCIREILIVLIV